MSTRERRLDRADRFAIAIRLRAGQELRTARRIAGLTQRRTGIAVGVSHAEIGRIERGRAPWVTLGTLCRIAAIVGLDLSVRLYPGPSPIRDVRHAALLASLRTHLAPSLSFRTEVPMPNAGDLRAWDAVIAASGARAGVEVETELHDTQALERRIALKQRDADVDVVILVVADTRRNRSAARAGGGTLVGSFPASGASILRDLSAGRVPTASGLVWLPVRRAC
jgi:transcriptional regulator with XRE-family HTH domain